MFAIRENTKTVLGESVTTYSREICDACCLEIEAGTNGYKGGDAGHGSRTYFRIANDGGTVMSVHAFGLYGRDGFEVCLGGDAELHSAIDALKFILQALEDGADEGGWQ